MRGVRWSVNTQMDYDRRKEIQKWYMLAVHLIKERQATFLGEPVDLNNPKEIIAFLYVWQKELSLFHEEI